MDGDKVDRCAWNMFAAANDILSMVGVDRATMDRATLVRDIAEEILKTNKGDPDDGA